MPRYSPDPNTAHVPFSPDEVEHLRTTKQRGIDSKRSVEHILSRTAATVAAAIAATDQLHGQVAALQQRTEGRKSLSSTLDPRDVLKYIHPDELKHHVEGHLRWQMEQVEGRLRAVTAREAAVAAAAQTLVHLAQAFTDRPDVPDDVAGQLAAVAATLT